MVLTWQYQWNSMKIQVWWSWPGKASWLNQVQQKCTLGVVIQKCQAHFVAYPHISHLWCHSFGHPGHIWGFLNNNRSGQNVMWVPEPLQHHWQPLAHLQHLAVLTLLDSPETKWMYLLSRAGLRELLHCLESEQRDQRVVSYQAWFKRQH